MKQYIFAAWLMVCGGCGGETLTSGPNPLETFDQDRLYVLIHAAVNRGRAADCARYFQEAGGEPSGNPNVGMASAVLSQVCPGSMARIAAYLEHNGVDGVQAAHVKAMAFWERMDVQAKADRERVRQEREQKQEARRKGRQAKAEARRQCREQADSENERRKLKSSRPLRTDFPDGKAWTAARDAWAAGALERSKEYRAARRACDSAGAAGAEEPRRAGEPALADLGISLPEGMRVDMLRKIN